ncbi:MAG: SAM-dependent chlorinase/fluorinase [Bacteroidales bacterium]|nr:SAM-dependent chlorinase/fluorinase [Bacteroidales bacterium]
MNTPLITITTDWGTKDHYVAVVKGRIIKAAPTARIVDISHQIAPFDLNQAAFVIRNSYHEFPKGTLHILAVNSEPFPEQPFVVVKADGYLFIGTDNGIFPLFLRNEPEEVVEIEIDKTMNLTFPGLDVFAQVAVTLLNGAPLEELGHHRDTLYQLIAHQPVTKGNSITGQVIYIDSYENLITNISKDFFMEVAQDRAFEITLRGTYTLKTIEKSYGDLEEGQIVAVFNSNNYLELAVNRGNAKGLLNSGLYSKVTVEFFEND